MQHYIPPCVSNQTDKQTVASNKDWIDIPTESYSSFTVDLLADCYKNSNSNIYSRLVHNIGRKYTDDLT